MSDLAGGGEVRRRGRTRSSVAGGVDVRVAVCARVCADPQTIAAARYSSSRTWALTKHVHASVPGRWRGSTVGGYNSRTRTRSTSGSGDGTGSGSNSDT